MHVEGDKYVRREGAQQGRRGHRRPRVCRYGYDSRGANFCVKNTDFPVSRLFVTEPLKASHEGPRTVSLFYIHERTFVAKQLKGEDARDVCDAFTSFLRTHDFLPTGPSGEASRARPPHRKRLDIGSRGASLRWRARRSFLPCL